LNIKLNNINYKISKMKNTAIGGILTILSLNYFAFACITSKDGLLHKVEPYGC